MKIAHTDTEFKKNIQGDVQLQVSGLDKRIKLEISVRESKIPWS